MSEDEKYIKLSEAINAIRNAAPDPLSTGNAQHFILAVRSVPAAEVKPVIHGTWRKLHQNKNGTYDWECSACLGILMDVPDDDEHDLIGFCPCCGADMRHVRPESVVNYKACAGSKCIPCTPTFPECAFCEYAVGDKE